ncbi:MAG: hypothetical protein RLZZ628_2941 [Bacteroidota bacterium]
MFAQYATGAKQDTAHFRKDEADERKIRALGRTMSVGQVLPKFASLRKWCPTVANQCYSPSCVAWATGYAAMTVRRAQQLNLTDRESIDAIAFSASYIFNKSSNHCNERAFSQIEPILEEGVCPAHLFPNTLICTTRPSEKDSLEACPFRVALFKPVFLPEDSKDDKILRLRQALNRYLPVVVQVRAVPSLFHPEKGLWKYQFNEPDTNGWAHAMCLVGYDDINKKFELMNSWGTDWGDNGFVRIGYEELLENALQTGGLLEAAYQLDLYPPKTAAFKGEILLERLVEAHDCVNSSYEQISIFKNNNIYNTKKQSFTRQDKIRFLFSTVLDTSYIYIFGQDAGTGIWNTYEKTLLKKPSTILPQNNHLLNFTSAGTEVVCCLFSDAPILDFEKRIQALSKQKVKNSDLFKILKKQFPAITTELESEKMAFQSGQMALMTVVLEIRE